MRRLLSCVFALAICASAWGATVPLPPGPVPPPPLPNLLPPLSTFTFGAPKAGGKVDLKLDLIWNGHFGNDVQVLAAPTDDLLNPVVLVPTFAQMQYGSGNLIQADYSNEYMVPDVTKQWQLTPILTTQYVKSGQAVIVPEGHSLVLMVLGLCTLGLFGTFRMRGTVLA